MSFAVFPPTANVEAVPKGTNDFQIDVLPRAAGLLILYQSPVDPGIPEVFICNSPTAFNSNLQALDRIKEITRLSLKMLWIIAGDKPG